MSAGGAQEPRRGVLKVILAACTAFGGLLVAVPGLRFLGAPLLLKRAKEEDDGDLQAAARLEELTPGMPVRVELRGAQRDGWERRENVNVGAAWLVRDESEKVRAFSTICPHLGCGVDWNQQTGQFQCPCHQSHFDGQGHCLSGPSPRDLDELEVVTTGAEVKVRYRRFKLSTSTKEPLS